MGVRQFGKFNDDNNLRTDGKLHCMLCYCLQDVNECNSKPCNQDAHCENTVASFTCTCNFGYEGNGFNCTGQLRTNFYSIIP